MRPLRDIRFKDGNSGIYLMKIRTSNGYNVPPSIAGENRLMKPNLIPPNIELKRSYTPHKPKPKLSTAQRRERILKRLDRVDRVDADGQPLSTAKNPSAERRPKDRPLRNSMFSPLDQVKPPWRVPEELQRIRDAYQIGVRTMAKMIGVNFNRLYDMSRLDSEGIPLTWLDADIALRIEHLTGVSALDLLAMDAATRIWVHQRTDIHRQMLMMLPILPSIMGRRPKESSDVDP